MMGAESSHATDLRARIAELDTDVALLIALAARLKGRLRFDAECALETTIAERADVRRAIQEGQAVQ